MTSSKLNKARFLAEFIQKPFSTGSLIPSSSHLAKMIVKQADLSNAKTVLEYGAGTGVFTDYILRELAPQSSFAAIEINPRLASIFRTTYPQVRLFEDSVENVRAICDSMQVETVDCIISGLPWAFFSRATQVVFLDQMMQVLKPGGRFVTFGYWQSLVLPAGRNLAALLPTYFTTVSRSPTVWLNVPPAFVYRCQR